MTFESKSVTINNEEDFMINLERNLTVDDLIVEYMIAKVTNGYEPQFSASEFIDFLKFFETKMSVKDSLYDGKKLFERFFSRKEISDWSIRPHMDIEYNPKDNEYLIRANYYLSAFDPSVLNTYYMDNGMSSYDDYKGKAYEIRRVIKEYLSTLPKRKINESTIIEEQNLLIGKHIAALVITDIWKSHIEKLIKNYTWPSQCRDINKYLFEVDLGEIIGTESIKNDLIELYGILSRRVAILYQEDKNLKIESKPGMYLAYANYELLIKDCENLMNKAFNEYGKSLEIDLSKFIFKESHEIDRVYYWNDDPEIKTTTTLVGGEETKKLVLSLDKHSKLN